MTRRALLPLLLTSLALLAGCGYGFVGQAPSVLPPEGRTLALDTIRNPTLETWLVPELVSRLRDEMTTRQKVTWVDKTQAASLMSLDIERFYLSSELSDARDKTLKYTANIRLNATIRRRLDGAVLWQSGQVPYSFSYFAANEQAARIEAVDQVVRRLVDRMAQAY